MAINRCSCRDKCPECLQGKYSERCGNIGVECFEDKPYCYGCKKTAEYRRGAFERLHPLHTDAGKARLSSKYWADYFALREQLFSNAAGLARSYRVMRDASGLAIVACFESDTLTGYLGTDPSPREIRALDPLPAPHRETLRSLRERAEAKDSEPCLKY